MGIPTDSEPRNILERLIRGVVRTFEAPAEWFRESVVVPNQHRYPWYHQKFRRVPTIDQCYTDDSVCIFEANSQYKRDRLVESEILSILRGRFEECVIYEAPDHKEKCQSLLDAYESASVDWFTKYGDLGYYHDVKLAFMKQKHRMIWERRHGEIGTGTKTSGEQTQAK